jgi:hypothetical protein
MPFMRLLDAAGPETEAEPESELAYAA